MAKSAEQPLPLQIMFAGCAPTKELGFQWKNAKAIHWFQFITTKSLTTLRDILYTTLFYHPSVLRMLMTFNAKVLVESTRIDESDRSSKPISCS